MSDYNIKKLENPNITNVRSQRTWEWRLADEKQISVMRRLKDEVFGNHFHKGDDPSKNPELILFLDGIAKIEFIDKNGVYSSAIINAENGPIELIIKPWLLHRLIGETNVLYIESRQSYFNPEASDTYPAEKFPYQFSN